MHIVKYEKDNSKSYYFFISEQCWVRKIRSKKKMLVIHIGQRILTITTLPWGPNKILEKIREESEEVIMAVEKEGKEEIIHEVADLWFHILVLLQDKNISLGEIESELAKRFGVSGLVEKASRGK